MDNKSTKNCDKITMTLKEPRKKRRVRLRPRKPFPINIGGDDEWTVYTGHLSNLGVCVTYPNEIEALHSMGFFGKGSLSRSYPNFEKTRGGVLPIVRRRQWDRRQDWLRQAKNLDAKSFLDDSNDQENVGQLDTDDRINQIEQNSEVQNSDESANSPPEKRLKSAPLEINKSIKNKGDELNQNVQKTGRALDDEAIVVSEIDVVEINSNLAKSSKSNSSAKSKVDEVVLDSSEDEDEICEISKTGTSKPTVVNPCSDKDIILLSDEKISVSLEGENSEDTENKETNTEDDIEMLESDLMVLPDSDSDIDDYLSKVKPTIQKEGFPVRETMHLTFEEAFFLMFGLGCLQIVDFDGNLLNILDAWDYFAHQRNDFVQKYVVYHYFRSHGWVVKPGLKYGGDFLLYKQGPPFYHASYIVIVEVLDGDTLIRDEAKTTRKMTWKKLFGLDRLSETAAKEILFAQVLWPSKIPRNEIPSSPELLAEFTVKELLYRRWIPKQNREEIDLEHENDELR